MLFAKTMSLIQQLRNRELGDTALKVSNIRFRKSDIGITEFKELLNANQLLYLKHLEVHSCLKLMNCSKSLVSIIIQKRKLEVIDIEKTTYLEPYEARLIIERCPNLKVFNFTPAWRRKSELLVEIYERYNICWGRDFYVVYRRIKKQLFLRKMSHVQRGAGVGTD